MLGYVVKETKDYEVISDFVRIMKHNIRPETKNLMETLIITRRLHYNAREGIAIGDMDSCKKDILKQFEDEVLVKEELSTKDIIFVADVRDLLNIEASIQFARRFEVPFYLVENEEVPEFFKLRDVKSYVDVHSELTTKELSTKEDRALTLLNYALSISGFDKVKFIMGDLKVVITCNVGENTTVKLLDNLSIVEDNYSDNLFVDRGIAKSIKPRSRTHNVLSLNDIKFILGHLNQLSVTLSNKFSVSKYDVSMRISEALAYNSWWDTVK